ncbi:tail fiber domain-containing protein [Thalassobacter stenotrophicus]|uniref:tail fiber domain-containing protein n=1 Tax=Thalassobacter stenotrophicus TaxID=266809 RepID=UPI0022A90199|nr:tail fiber domain-containing protein [Thalassobacter stenotrophicus]UYP69628.1 tail fiber domain-containing protein [Thalassobacter stenotrophicus]
MTQTSSFTIANDAGAAVRARINEVIAALQSTNAGATAPSAAVAGMLWVDTSVSPPVLRRRNATNTGWDALLDAAGNLAGLANTAVARTNLGLGSMATKSAADYDAVIAAKATLSGATFTGVVTAPNFVSSSDARLKSDVATIADALALVCALRGVRFTMDGSRQIGVVAQEVEAVLPEVVQVDAESGQLSVAYGNITGLLIEAVKELSARVAELEEARL